jgi:hypothetical protein
MDMANNPNYVPVERDGPSGPQMVYVRSDAGKQKDAERREAGTRRRLMDSAGIDSLGAAGLSTDDLRNRAADSRAADLRQRQSTWRAQAMLAGGQPTGGPRGTKAATNALLMLPQEWQNAVLAKGLRPDLDGTTPLTVEANSAKNAMRLLNAETLAQGGLGDTRAQMMEQQNRQKAADYLIKAGNTQLTLRDNNTFSGTLTVLGSVLSLADQGRVSGANRVDMGKGL